MLSKKEVLILRNNFLFSIKARLIAKTLKNVSRTMELLVCYLPRNPIRHLFVIICFKYEKFGNFKISLNLAEIFVKLIEKLVKKYIYNYFCKKKAN